MDSTLLSPQQAEATSTSNRPGRGSARRPRRLAWAAAIVAAGAGLAVVTALGGFGFRDDTAVLLSPGEVFDAGNLLVTTRSAATFRELAWDESATWVVLVDLQVSNPHDEASAPLSGEDGNFHLVLRDGTSLSPAIGGTIAGSSARPYILPGMLATDLQLRFELPAGMEPGTKVALAISPMEFTDNYIMGLGGGEQRWNLDSGAAVGAVVLEPKVLADRNP